MRAARCHELGGPSRLRIDVVAEPEVGPGDVLIRVQAAGVNFPDGLMVAGTYQTKPELPFSPGSEVAGVLLAVGEGVQHLSVGDRVLAFCGIGGYAEQIRVPATMVFPIPDVMDIEHAATFPVVYGTSFHGLVDRAAVQAGDTVLVLGASGGVGLTAVQIGRALGARVIAAASSPEKLALCTDHGADAVIDYRQEDLADRIRELTDGGGVDVVYDPVGGAVAETAVRHLAWGGRYLTVGYASGDIPLVGMNRMLLKESALLGVLWGAWARRNPAANAANTATLLQWYADGRLRPHVSRSFPLAEAADALELVMSRQALGKIVLRMEGQ